MFGIEDFFCEFSFFEFKDAAVYTRCACVTVTAGDEVVSYREFPEIEP